jgi:cyclohexadienyl dehydratase
MTICGWLCLAIAGCMSNPVRTPAATATDAAARAPSVVAPTSAVLTATAPHFADETAIASLAQAIEDRLDIMRDVAAAKWISGAAILDPAREQAVLQQVATRAVTLGLDGATTQAFFAEQMRLARIVQQQWHEQWRAAGHCAPCDEPARLQAVRARIDVTNEQELALLALLAPMRAAVATSLQKQIAVATVQRGVTPSDAAALASAAVTVTRAADGLVLERIRATQVLRIGTTGDYAPFSLESGGTLAGADIDMGLRLAAHLGVEPVFVRTSWPGLSDDLRHGRFDIAISGIGPTPERAALGSFSLPYHSGGKTLLARCADRARFDSPEDIDQPGVRVIVNPGGTNERYVREHVSRAQVIVHPDNRGVFAEIAAGHADVMVTDDVEAELQARRWPGLLCRTYAGTLTQGEKRILMLRDPALLSAVDAWLAGEIAAGVPARALERAMRDDPGVAAAR